LKGLISVLVSVTWTGGVDPDRDALQGDVELKVRQAGMHVLTAGQQAQTFADAQAVTFGSMLFVGVGGSGAAIPVTLELHEKVYLPRDLVSAMKFTALDAYSQWHDARMKEPSPITEAEMNEHMAPVEAETKENRCLSSSTLMRDAAIWERHGIAQSVQPESAQSIVARYRPAILEASQNGRPFLEHMMDLEVQAAMAEAQRPANPGTVRDTIRGFVDQFVNEWLAANPKQH